MSSVEYAYCEEWVQSAQDALCQFVLLAKDVFGDEIAVYNLHNLVHLPDDVRKFGPLDGFSAFAFENFLGSLKRLVRSGRLPLQQIVN